MGATSRTGDDDCTFGGVLEGLICLPSDSVPYCQPGCSNDDDCATLGLPDWTCNGINCESPPCTEDPACSGPGLACNPETGLCEPSCANDGDCNGVCNSDTRRCECTGDGQCDAGYVCAPV